MAIITLNSQNSILNLTFFLYCTTHFHKTIKIFLKCFFLIDCYIDM